jgi:uncharacterized protein (TIGR02421 family)
MTKTSVQHILGTQVHKRHSTSAYSHKNKQLAQKYLNRLKKIDLLFEFVTSHISFSQINPTNIDTITVKNVHKIAKNPITFAYSDINDLSLFIPILEQIEFDKSPLHELFARKRNELIFKIKLLHARGTKEFAKKSEILYEVPDAKLCKIAKQILRKPVQFHIQIKKQKNASKRQVSPEQTELVYVSQRESKKILVQTLKKLKLDWKVVLREQIASAEVEATTKTIYLKRKEKFQRNYIQRLCVHEIGTHVLRAENGERQVFSLFKTGFANYLATEEGLAAYNEFCAGVMTEHILRDYAARVLAISYAKRHTFLQTYEYLQKYVSPNVALKLTKRVKRGLIDTNSKGAYTKDATYLRGLIQVTEYAKHAKKRDFEKLYIGKISISDLAILEKLEKSENEKFPKIKIQKPKYLLANILPHIIESKRKISKLPF